ncbi:MAG: tRNA pseudouridine(55) synthase TruB [Candidatus Saccharibacteria bacterium]|nr:tRNA pseudouridine(55) synthase TruB [Candidatus Saccharibacteria bacterium]
MEEIILVDKPSGMSSFGAVARVRRLLSEREGHKVKVGHTGTLDPFATGLLILLAGKATKKAPELTKLDKVYEATIRLGATSSTGDPEGEITITDKKPEISREKIIETLAQFVGEIEQTPPAFSAIKINGQRAYKLARAGKAVEMPKRKVTIYELELLDYASPFLKIRTHVSSGTYIRTLAEDIGEVLDCGAYTTELRRTKIADYDIAELPLFDLPQ